MVKVHTTFQRRAYTSKSGHSDLDKILRQCAQLYNDELAHWISAYRDFGCSVSLYDRQRAFTLKRKWNPGKADWSDVSVQVGRGVIQRLERAKSAFFRRCKAGQTPGFPRFKSRYRWRTIEIAQVYSGMVKGNKIKIKGLPTITIKDGGLPDSSQLKTLSITKHGRRVTVSLGYEVEKEQLPFNPSGVGIDMGITDRLTLSTGESIDRRENDREEVVKKQRRLSRCKKGSRRFKQRSEILSNAHSRRKVRNRNECHRITSKIIQDFGHVAVEKLNVKNMSKSGRGKHGLNREINEQTWGIIHQQLKYKAEWAGRNFVEVDPKFTSQTCNSCGMIDKNNRIGKTFDCIFCSVKIDADLNAAKNIIRKSLAGGNKDLGLPLSILS